MTIRLARKYLFTAAAAASLLASSGCKSTPAPVSAPVARLERLSAGGQAPIVIDRPPVDQPFPEGGYRAGLKIVGITPRVVTAGAEESLKITITNLGTATFPNRPDSQGRFSVNLTYRTFTAAEKPQIVVNGERAFMPLPLAPGQTVTISLPVRYPETPGKYRMRIDLVHEMLAWFEDRGNPAIVLPLEVKA